MELPPPFGNDTYIISCPVHGVIGVFGTVQKFKDLDGLEIDGKTYFESMPYLAFLKKYN